MVNSTTPRRVPPITRDAWALMSMPLVTALFATSVLAWMSGPLGQLSEWPSVVTILAFTNVPPFSALVLIVFTSQRWPLGMPAVLAGALAQLVAAAVLYGDLLTSRSSTAGVALPLVPAALVILLVPSFLSADWLHRRRQSHLSQV